MEIELAGELDAVAEDAVEIQVSVHDSTPVETEHARAHEDVEVGADVARPQRLPQPQHLQPPLMSHPSPHNVSVLGPVTLRS